MKKAFRLILVIALMAGFASCNRLPKLSELEETVGDIKRTIDEAQRVYSEDPESFWDEEPEEEVMMDDVQYDLSGYEWLRGVWAGADDPYTFGRLIVDDYFYHVVNSNMDNPFDNVEDMLGGSIELGSRRDYVTGEGDGYIFGLSDYIGVDAAHRCVYIIQGEYQSIVLRKISSDITDEAIFEANHNYPKRVYSNAYDGFVNIRQNADSKSPVLGVLNNGPEGAVLLSREGDWTQVRLYGIEGYVASRFVQDTPTEVYVASEKKKPVEITIIEDDMEARDIDITADITGETVVEVSTGSIDDEVFAIVEEMPEFPGGMNKLAEYLAQNVKYPQMARETGIKGRVFVSFVVEPDGSVSNVQVLRGIGGGCDEEAVRVVKAMPKWKPGKQRGKAVRVSYNLPVNFQLN